MKSILIGLLAWFASSLAFGDVLVVNIWDPLPGKGASTVQNTMEARAIHEKMGAQVVLGADQMGRVHYAVGFKNWVEWAKFGEKMEASEEWQAFWSRVSASPSAVLEQQYMLNQPAPGAIKNVYQVFIWQSKPGRAAETVQNAMGAKAIHDKSGASVGINVDPFGRVHYVISFDSWTDWGKFQDGPSDEFQAYMAKINENPSAELVQIYTAERL